MAKDLNYVVIIGRLVRDPETKYTASGTAITKFSIANNDTYMQNNERKEHTNFFDINVWGNQAINCEKYLKKGNQVAVSGYLRQNRWQDQNGQARSKIEITANSVQFLTPAGGGYQAEKVTPPQFQQQQQPLSGESGFIEDPWGDNNKVESPTPNLQQNVSDDDIPF